MSSVYTFAQLTKTVAAAATPEAIAADGTYFVSAFIVGKKAARTDNVGTIYVGIGSTNNSQPIPINPGEIVTLSMGEGQEGDLNDWYVDVETAGDGVVVIYTEPLGTVYTFTADKRATVEYATKTTDVNILSENTDWLYEKIDTEHSVDDGTHQLITCTGIDKSGGTGSVGSGTKRTIYPVMELDTTNPPDTGMVGYHSAILFDPDTDEIVYFGFKIPVDCDITADITLRLGFCMATANAGAVVMAIAYTVVSDAGDITPAADTGTDTVTIDTSNSAEIFESDTSLAVANAHISATTQIVGVKLYRDANAGADTHTGDFELVSLELEYTTIS